MTLMRNHRYKTKWDGLTYDEVFALSKKLENESIAYLIKYCGFDQIIHTAESIRTKAKESNLAIPDSLGTRASKQFFIEFKHKNRRIKYEDNGIDTAKINDYLKAEIIFGIPVIVLFKDDQSELESVGVESRFKEDGECVLYGNFLKKLCLETPQNSVTVWKGTGTNGITYFPLTNMVRAKDLFRTHQTHLKISEDFE